MGGFQSFRCGKNKKSRDGSGVNNCYDWSGRFQFGGRGQNPIIYPAAVISEFSKFMQFFSPNYWKIINFENQENQRDPTNT